MMATIQFDKEQGLNNTDKMDRKLKKRFGSSSKLSCANNPSKVLFTSSSSHLLFFLAKKRSWNKKKEWKTARNKNTGCENLKWSWFVMFIFQDSWKKGPSCSAKEMRIRNVKKERGEVVVKVVMR